MRILTYTAVGTVAPYTLQDIHAAVNQLGFDVFVQDIAAVNNTVAIIDGVVDVQPDIVLTLDTIGIDPLLLAAADPNLKIISWFYDNPLIFLQDRYARDLVVSYTYIADRYFIYSWDRAYIEAIGKIGFNFADYMPYGTNPAVYHPLHVRSYTYDVSFVGTYTEHRAQVICSVADAGFGVDVFGDVRWGSLSHAGIRFHGMADNRRDCPVVYRESRINLNITNAQLLTSLPVRIFDVMSSGGFVLTDYRDDLERMFDIGNDLVVYLDTRDLCDKIRAYLADETERERIAATGMNKVRRDYTCRQRVSEMITDVANTKIGGNRRPLPAREGCYALWVVGLSYLKFGRFAEAAARFNAILELAPTQADALLCLAVTASHSRNMELLDYCMAVLTRLDSGYRYLGEQLTAAAVSGEKVQLWDHLYHDALKSALGVDGFVPGWAPTVYQG